MIQEGNDLLPESDVEYLRAKGFQYRAVQDGGVVALTILEFELPPHYAPVKCELMVRLPSSYPNAHPDMFWTIPTIARANGGSPQAADVFEPYLGRQWQRWSRHFQGTWRAGIDGLASYLAVIRRELEKGV
jgi:hypothetical protein